LFKIKIKQSGDLKKLSKTLEKLESLKARIGVLSDVIHPNANMEMWKLAAIHIYGVPALNIPKRDFLFQPTQAKIDKIKKLIQAQMVLLVDGKITAQELFERVATYIQGVSQASFRNNDWAPNSKYTVFKKGSSTPLIDTGTLRRSITYTVEAKNDS
jgi:phage gpG-like protein